MQFLIYSKYSMISCKLFIFIYDWSFIWSREFLGFVKVYLSGMLKFLIMCKLFELYYFNLSFFLVIGCYFNYSGILDVSYKFVVILFFLLFFLWIYLGVVWFMLWFGEY